jgi:hypothetical protein
MFIASSRMVHRPFLAVNTFSFVAKPVCHLVPPCHHNNIIFVIIHSYASCMHAGRCEAGLSEPLPMPSLQRMSSTTALLQRSWDAILRTLLISTMAQSGRSSYWLMKGMHALVHTLVHHGVMLCTYCINAILAT